MPSGINSLTAEAQTTQQPASEAHQSPLLPKSDSSNLRRIQAAAAAIPEDEAEREKQAEVRLVLPSPPSDEERIAQQLQLLSSPQSNPFKTVGGWTLAIISAVPSAIYALTAPSGQQPKNIGSKWWGAMSLKNKSLSLVYALSSTVVNAVINKEYVPAAWEKLKESTNNWRNNKLKISLSQIIALSSAVAAFALAYNGFTWLNIETAAIIGTVNATIYYVTRFVGVMSIFSKIKNMFNKDHRFQQEVIDAFQRIDHAKKAQIESEMQHLFDNQTLNEQTFLVLMQRLEQLNVDPADPVFRDKNRGDYAKAVAETVLDVLLSLSALGAWITFDQKFIDGLKVFTQHATDLPKLYQGLAGSIPGAGSAMLYVSSALDLATKLREVTEYICYESDNKCADLTKVAIILTANVFASNSMLNVAEGITENPHQVFPLASGTTLAKIYMYDNQVGGGMTNMRPCLSNAFPLKANTQNPKVVDAVRWLKQTPLSSPTVEALKSFSLFNHQASDAYLAIEDDANLEEGLGRLASPTPLQ